MNEEEITTTAIPTTEQPLPPPSSNRRLVLVGIVLTTAGILYVLYRLLTYQSSPPLTVAPQTTITIQKKMQKQQTRTLNDNIKQHKRHNKQNLTRSHKNKQEQ